MRRLLLISLFLAACGGGHKPTVVAQPTPKPDPIPKTAGPDCKAVADHVVTVMLADKPDLQAKMSEAIRSHCTADKWSDEARSCLATMQNEAEGDGCEKMLTDAQRKAVDGESVGSSSSAAMPPPGAPAEPKPTRATRGATKKDPKDAKGVPTKNSGDPCQGGE